MGYKDLNRETASHFLDRIGKVREDSERRWGSMTPGRMLAHVGLLVKVSLGEVPVEGNGQIPFRWLKSIVLSGVLPFPKNKLKAPAVVLRDDAGSVAEECGGLQDSIERFLDLYEQDPDGRRTNPVFGPLTMGQWARIHGLHLNHHLGQFGV